MKFLVFILILLSACSLHRSRDYPQVQLDQAELAKTIATLSREIGPRNLQHTDSLDSTANYIEEQLINSGYAPERQEYFAQGEKVTNLIASIGPDNAPRMIVGAHYDTFGEQPGADDNASGIAGLLALAKLLKPYENKLNKRIDLVAFTLEEPPFFRTEYMGSYVHAKSLHDAKVDVIGMVSLEMIGYFDDRENSQSFPLSIMKLIYPVTGDFVSLVSNFSSNGLRSEFAEHMEHADINVESLIAPSSIAGVDYSDHMNYWHFDYDALMVTDTSFYRNPNYHKTSDKLETLNLDKMSEVICGVYYAVLNIALASE